MSTGGGGVTRNVTRLIVVGLMLFALPACPGTNDRVFTFEFGMLDPNKDVEILNWRYGNSKVAYTHADTGYLATRHIPQAENTTGRFPPGDVLYVKWRVLSTGKEYENKVDLTSQLPDDMSGKTIHFSVKGPQLFVYLIDTKQGHIPGKDCPALLYKDCKCTRLYPDHWSNFDEPAT